MGRKAKLGKRRKDKFYHLAKETGYRARSAFKLIQLNRKFHFLQKSRVLVDLCAAPGGWLQVAAKFMPVSSLIIGIDLVPIRSISNVITLQEDITTARCKQQLQSELKTWKVDCMLNDGAPNVGSAWVQDAFSQAELTLSAVKLATEFLREGGWFITKVFRSKEYQLLMWVLQQLFKKVSATKPQASRIESAEIFVVCQGYLAPSKVDPKLLDPRFVFKEVDGGDEKEQKINLTKIQKQPKAEGYPEDARILYKTVSVADYVTGDNYLQILVSANKLEFDKMSEVFSKHPLTTDEIRASCDDIKVLGPRDLKQLVKWREKLRKFLDEVESDSEDSGACEGVDGVSGEDKMDQQIERLRKEEAAEVKREQRRLRQQRKKLKERLVKNRSVNDEAGEIVRQEHLFRLKEIKTRAQLEEVDKGEMEDEEEEDSDEDEGSIESDALSESEEESDVGEEVESGASEEEGDSVSEASGEERESDESESEKDEEVLEQDGGPDNPLVVSLDDGSTPRSSRTSLWFSKAEFSSLSNDHDEDMELEQMVQHYKAVGGRVPKAAKREKISSQGKEEKSTRRNEETPEEAQSESEDNQEDSEVESESEDAPQIAPCNESNSSSDDDSSDEDDLHIAQAKADYTQKHLNGDTKETDSNTVEVVPISQTLGKRKLDPEGMALGAIMIQSKKKREELIDGAYNRWTSNDDNLPDWFVADEAKFCMKQIPISKEMVDQYRSKLKDIDSRPINKIVEAKARKKKRALRKMEKIRKKAEVITGAEEVSSQEKAQQLRQMYRKAATGDKKKEVTYVVAKKRNTGKRMPRPAGVKGHYKVVDPRMKKDNRSKQSKGKSHTARGKGKRKH